MEHVNLLPASLVVETRPENKEHTHNQNPERQTTLHSALRNYTCNPQKKANYTCRRRSCRLDPAPAGLCASLPPALHRAAELLASLHLHRAPWPKVLYLQGPSWLRTHPSFCRRTTRTAAGDVHLGGGDGELWLGARWRRDQPPTALCAGVTFFLVFSL
jgi:hypothetical protein